jgi:predicted transposase YdaD
MPAMEFQRGGEAQDEPQQDQTHPGPIYDRAMRTFAEDDPDAFCDLRTIYLRESDPAELMAYPNLAGLTVLAQGDTHARGRALADAIQRVRDLPEERQERLTNAMLAVATIALDRSTIDLIVKESGMTIETVAEFYSGTEVGQELRNQGRVEGRVEGREEGAARTLAALLRARFGDHAQVRTIAEHLAHTLDDDASIRIVTEAHTLDDLSSWLVPTQPDAL